MNKFFTILALVLLSSLICTSVDAKTKSNTSKNEVKKIKVLIVPGHDDEVWGTQYGNLKEADMTLSVGRRLYADLKKDKRFEVYITRTTGSYTPTFSNYFAKAAEIEDFKQNAKKTMLANVMEGIFVKKPGAPHHNVNQAVSLRLYGINKWINENNIDAVIHIHFNDYARPNNLFIGPYKGFTVYTPDSQLSNSAESNNLGKSVFKQLVKNYDTSTFPDEKGGLMPDQKLIALGANGTLNKNTRSILVEYGYIYEKKFRDSKTRHEAYQTMAEVTAKGIKNYFFNKR